MKNIIISIATGIVLSACSSEAKQANVLSSNSEVGLVTDLQKINKRFEGYGKVISITPNKKQIIVKHDLIPGFMDAMIMPFNISDSSLLEGIHPKDSIKLSIDYDGTVVVLKEILKVK